MPDDVAASLPVRYANGRFGPGNPGRRAGARNRASHQVAMAILRDFETNRETVLERLREYFTPAYFAILTRMLDQQLKSEVPEGDDEAEADGPP